MMASHGNAFQIFGKVKGMNFLYLTQANDPPVKDDKPITYIGRLQARLNAWMPPRTAPLAPVRSGAMLLGSPTSAALFPSKQARETASAMGANAAKANGAISM